MEELYVVTLCSIDINTVEVAMIGIPEAESILAAIR